MQLGNNLSVVFDHHCTEDKGERVKPEFRSSATEEAYKMGLRILLKSPKSSAEMRTLLLGKNLNANAADEAIEKLEELGYLNDYELAHRMVRKGQAKGWGPKKIRMELKARGLEARPDHFEQNEDDELPKLIEMVVNQRDKGKSDNQIGASLMRLGHRKPAILKALKEAPQSQWEMTIPPGLLDLDDFELEDLP
jgi:regulatory protein